MKIPIPALVVPLICLLLYLFVPGLRQRPWTALRIAGATVAIAGYFLLITARIQLGRSFSVSPQAKELVTHGLYSRDPQSNLCQRCRDVAWTNRGPPSVLVDPSFSGDALRPSISFGPRGKGPTREVRTNISRLPKADLVLIMGLGTGPIPVGDANHITAQKRTRFGIGIAFRLYYRQ